LLVAISFGAVGWSVAYYVLTLVGPTQFQRRCRRAVSQTRNLYRHSAVDYRDNDGVRIPVR